MATIRNKRTGTEITVHELLIPEHNQWIKYTVIGEDWASQTVLMTTVVAGRMKRLAVSHAVFFSSYWKYRKPDDLMSILQEDLRHANEAATRETMLRQATKPLTESYVGMGGNDLLENNYTVPSAVVYRKKELLIEPAEEKEGSAVEHLADPAEAACELW